MTTYYDVEVIGTSREVYRIAAASADAARRAYEANIASGLLTPTVAETYGGDVESVTEVVP